jgi:hypothetical protein
MSFLRKQESRFFDADCADYAVFYYTLSATGAAGLLFPLLLTTIVRIILTRTGVT